MTNRISPFVHRTLRPRAFSVAFGPVLWLAITQGSTWATADTPPIQGSEASAPGEAKKEPPRAPDTGEARGAPDVEASETELKDLTDERNRALSDRIKAVQKKAFLKKDRFELFPYFAIDLNDPFYQHMLVGGSVAYHIGDAFAVEARGGYAVARLRQSTLRVARQQAGIVIQNAEFKYHGDFDLLWAPIYGKISLMGETILHFDTYLTVGPGIFGTDAGINPAFNVGIGQRYFLTRWLTARIELRDYVFVDTRSDRSDLQNLMVLGFSVSGFFPTSFRYEFD